MLTRRTFLAAVCRADRAPLTKPNLLYIVVDWCWSLSILEKLTPGLSGRKYREAVREFREAYGLEKERHQLTLHRSQPGEIETDNGAATG
jgi:hypothetical protein